MSEQNNQNSLREAENNVSVEGLLLEKDIHKGTTSKNVPYLSVDLTLEVDENEQHRVSMFATETKKDGTPNKLYESLTTVAEDYKAVGDDGVGREEADYVNVNQAQFRMNDYVGKDGNVRSFPQINAVFANRVEGRDPNPHAKFDVEIVVAGVVEEHDKDENETGRAVLKGYLPLYGGQVAPMEFVVDGEGGGAEYVLDNYENGNTVQVWGTLINKREEHTTKVEGAFGGDKEKTTYTTIREYLVSGGSEAYDEDSAKAYDTSLIKKALSEREVYLEELKEKNKEKQTGAKQGFGGGAKKKTKKVDISDDSLPF